MKGQCVIETEIAEKAKTYTASRLADGKFILVGMGYDKYGRLLARIKVEDEGKVSDLGYLLLQHGLAKPWLGHHATWCGQ